MQLYQRGIPVLHRLIKTVSRKLSTSLPVRYAKLSRKENLKLRFSFQLEIKKAVALKNMADKNPEIEKLLSGLRASVKEQGDLIRSLKDSGAATIDVQKAVVELKARKKKLEDKEIELAPKEDWIDRLKLEDLLKRRFFYDQSFAIYGGVTGLYDFGPMGCAMKSNMLHVWRNHFVLEEGMLEVSCAMLTPENVLKASGHVERFQDYMVKDLKTGECFRADHLIKGFAEKQLEDKKMEESLRQDFIKTLAMLDGFSKEDMGETITKHKMKSPITGNDLSEPIPFNLMFPTSIGPTGLLQGYLRPETAQGIFVNFKRLLEFNQGKLPFAAAQIGTSFRNEISPRQGLLRVREFTMAEIEHFVDPELKQHPKFHKVKDYEMVFFSACNQMDGKPAVSVKLGEAVSSGMVANETLGYYLARTHQFMVKVGVTPHKLRFRQHLSNEMAHYATDCWDAECLTSYGWVECVGNADRACYDLNQHYKATGVKLAAEKRLATPKKVHVVEAIPNKGLLGKTFKRETKLVTNYLEKLNEEECAKLDADIKENQKVTITSEGKELMLTSEMVEVKSYEKTIHVEEVVPSVIEPSFGIGRIMYSVLEHNFLTREGDEQRSYLTLPAVIAPVKCSVLPLSSHADFAPFVERLSQAMTDHDVSHKVDDSSISIGRRYARTDEIGIPYGITVDFDSVKEPHSATLRERNSMKQVRVLLDELPSVVRDLCNGRSTWDNVMEKYPAFQQQEAKDAGKPAA